MKNIAIMGFKNCGKSHIGKALADKLGKQFIEFDDVISEVHEKEKGEKLPYREIHKKYGPEYFRALETRAIKSLLEVKNSVIALGGGSVAYPNNGDLLKKNCILVYLKDSPNRLLERIKRLGMPAFLDPNDLEGSMRKELARL